MKSLAVVAAWVAFLGAIRAEAQRALPFDTVRLDVDRAESIHTDDLNGDGRPDLLICARREARVFLTRPAGAFPARPDAVVTFAPSVYLWTLCRLADSEVPQLVTFSARGIHRHRPRPDGSWGPADDLIIHPNLFDGDSPRDEAPLRVEFMRDLDGDGLPEALFFRRGELWVFPQTREASGHPAFHVSEKLTIPEDRELRVRYGPHERSARVSSVPLMSFGDANGDGRPDILCYHEEVIGLYFQKPGLRFETSEPRSLTGERPKRRSHLLKFEAPPRIADFNHDGLLDVAVPFPTKGRAFIYFNRTGRVDFTTPDQKFEPGDSFTSGLYVKDLDGDGKLEIIMGVVARPGFLGGLQTFLSGKLPLQLHVYRIDRDMFSRQPIQILEIAVPFTFHVTRESQEVDLTFWPEFDGDYDGDGLKDLLVQKDPSALHVHFGDRKTALSESAGGVIPIAPPKGVSTTKAFSADFNGDGRSDLVIRYEMVEPRRDVVEVLLSRD